MKKSFTILTFLATSLFTNIAYCAPSVAPYEELGVDNSDMAEDEYGALEAFFTLDWKEPDKYELSKSKSTISIPEGYHVLLGDDAHKALALSLEPRRENMEAIVYDDTFDNMIVFQSIKIGYVSIEDWNDIDSKQLMESIIENTKRVS